MEAKQEVSGSAEQVAAGESVRQELEKTNQKIHFEFNIDGVNAKIGSVHVQVTLNGSGASVA